MNFARTYFSVGLNLSSSIVSPAKHQDPSSSSFHAYIIKNSLGLKKPPIFTLRRAKRGVKSGGHRSARTQLVVLLLARSHLHLTL